MDSIRGARRTGSRFEENGNLMKKRTYSRFINFEEKGLKRKNTMTNSCKQDDVQPKKN